MSVTENKRNHKKANGGFWTKLTTENKTLQIQKNLLQIKLDETYTAHEQKIEEHVIKLTEIDQTTLHEHEQHT